MSRTIALLLNPAAARSRHVRLWPTIGSVLASSGHEVRMLLGTGPEQALELAQKAVADGVDALVAVGGDGTVSIALQAVAHTGTPLGIVPLGTGNDNARMLGIHPRRPAAGLRQVIRFEPRNVDVGSVLSDDGTLRYFLSVAAIGFDSQVGERMRRATWPSGSLQYVASALAQLRDLRSARFTIMIDGEELSGPTVLTAVGNGEFYGNGMRMCPGARLDDGLLTMTWIHECTARQLVSCIAGIYAGDHLRRDFVSQHTGREIRIEAPGEVIYAEGERIGAAPATIRVHPGGVRVLAPERG